MFCRITIPRMSSHYKLYIFSSKNANDINTISKVRAIQPTYIIDEAIAQSQNINGIDSYVIDDIPGITQPSGITYVGPAPNYIPVIEYDCSIGVIKINNYTYANKLTLKPLNTNYVGTIIYYSVIAVNEAMNTISHLSKVSQVLIDCKYETTSIRHIYSCDDLEQDNWIQVGTASWQEEIIIGDLGDKASLARFGIPFVETVPSINPEKVNFDTRPILSDNFGVLEIQNPWQRNNKYFNFRKLKSYRVQNVIGNNYGPMSEGTYPSLLPVSIEKMVILRKTDSQEIDIPLSEQYTQDVETFEVIRRDGVYYKANEHKKLGINKYNVPLGETLAVFGESSVQDLIKMQIPATLNHRYTYSIYLIDVYGNTSAPTTFTVGT